MSDLHTVRQDGYPPGALERFTVSETGEISGIFENGMTQPLGKSCWRDFATLGNCIALPLVYMPKRRGPGRHVSVNRAARLLSCGIY